MDEEIVYSASIQDQLILTMLIKLAGRGQTLVDRGAVSATIHCMPRKSLKSDLEYTTVSFFREDDSFITKVHVLPDARIFRDEDELSSDVKLPKE
ncbi:hypothetical protein DACRYDRAFT_24393 [Dacryopinax primogenitus]|uniref:Uncharacterized protein n=1 Tax=Dacryopinax primogenitus (strain DJM 731) TaxID=1858805 RepID=M5FST6_DACPD|nr:uncharacterized protein DACRYDRAFT_24393 [Dacryopinax primogenitus]EJT98329.1 hypothetical protein DACRYDRAFT_24393 [Dacryopinax primogenitus]